MSSQAVSVTSNTQYKYFIILVVVYCSLLCCGDLLGARLILLSSVTVSAGSFITSTNYILSDLVTDVYGYQFGRQLIWLGIMTTIIFSCVNSVLNAFPAPSYWMSKMAFDQVLNVSFRTAIAYIVAILTGDFLNIYIISRWKIFVSGRYYLVRVITCSIVGETVYVILFYCILMLGSLPLAKIWPLMLTSLLTKILFGIIAAIPTSFIAQRLKRIEECDAFDHNVNYNPFRFLIRDDVKKQSDTD